MNSKGKTKGVTGNEASPRSKYSKSFLLVLAFILLGGLVIFGMNYWHSTRCHEAHTKEEIDNMSDAFQRRLLTAESEMLASSIELERFISAMEEELVTLEDVEMQKLMNHKLREGSDKHESLSHLIYNDDAVAKVQLALAAQPSPPRHKFHLDQKFHNAEVLADRINEIFAAIDDSGGSYRESHSADGAIDSEQISGASVRGWKNVYPRFEGDISGASI